MQVLVPVDGTEPSTEALRFGIEFADRYDADLDAIHITDFQDEATEQLLEEANDILTRAGREGTVEVVTYPNLDNAGVSSDIGEHVLDIIEEREYDHAVMGRHGGGKLEELVLGSASEKVVKEASVPVTVVH